jgi:urease subunit gamma
MRLSEREQERLLVTVAADVAARREARGLRLNHPESVAILTCSCWKARATGGRWPT